jgi:hypothetical protein
VQRRTVPEPLPDPVIRSGQHPISEDRAL